MKKSFRVISRSEKVKTLASALTPCYLRVGGTDADFLIFDDGMGRKRDTDIWNSTYTTSKFIREVLSHMYPRSRSRFKRDIGLDRDYTNFTMSGE